MGKKLHIISLDIPYPADYGGVIDIFYKVKSLHALGIEITLHCFQYGDRKPANELNQFCKQVFYYQRTTGLNGLHTTLPYIVSSRDSKMLLKNLLNDEAPILFEGIHTTFYANHPSLATRKKILRAHNIESNYYAALAKNTHSFFKKIYYSFEANRLNVYEKQFGIFDIILSISEQDYAFFKQAYPSVRHEYIPAFHPNDVVDIQAGAGTYCLYHGNLSVDENKKAVFFLANEIFSQLDIPLIIAGKHPDKDIVALQSKHLQIIANPSQDELNKLIQKAHINVLPGFQETGLKLKLLHALFLGRHCLVNEMYIETGLRSSLHIAKTKELFIDSINQLMAQAITEQDIESRRNALMFYRNKNHAATLVGLL